jgi:hypothetical protein
MDRTPEQSEEDHQRPSATYGYPSTRAAVLTSHGDVRLIIRTLFADGKDPARLAGVEVFIFAHQVMIVVKGRKGDEGWRERQVQLNAIAGEIMQLELPGAGVGVWKRFGFEGHLGGIYHSDMVWGKMVKLMQEVARIEEISFQPVGVEGRVHVAVVPRVTDFPEEGPFFRMDGNGIRM